VLQILSMQLAIRYHISAIITYNLLMLKREKTNADISH